MQLHPFINILKINNKLKETIFWNQIKNETCMQETFSQSVHLAVHHFMTDCSHQHSLLVQSR